MIVSDFFHWEHLGDWSFDPSEWPDPVAMVNELKAMGTELMVSVWPSVSPLSRQLSIDVGTWSIDSKRAKCTSALLLAGTRRELPDRSFLLRLHQPSSTRLHLGTGGRRTTTTRGSELFWLDACEPEMKPDYPASLRFAAGPGLEVANLYPREHARGFYEGMLRCGEEEVLLLCRSGWAGSQRYGAAIWTGDTPSTFESFRMQVRAGLNMALSGIPWWTTDIGGFFKGDPDDPEYRELLVRWFEYGAFCPLFRLHGDRLPNAAMGADMTGGPNEIWSLR